MSRKEANGRVFARRVYFADVTHDEIKPFLQRKRLLTIDARSGGVKK
jgi:hypothetical protein